MKITIPILFVLIACGDSAQRLPAVDAGPFPDAMPSDAPLDAVADMGIDILPDSSVRTDSAPPPDAGNPDAFELPDSPPDTMEPPPDAGNPDSAPLVDAGSPDTSPPMDAGPLPPDCNTIRVVTFAAEAIEWSRSGSATEAKTLRYSGTLQRTERHRLGIDIEALDPRSMVRVSVMGCPTTIQTCADQNDIDRSIPFPNPGHDSCQVTGTGSARMGVSCAFDDPAAQIEIVVSNSTLSESDPAFCNPGFTIDAFEVADPSRPSAFYP